MSGSHVDLGDDEDEVGGEEEEEEEDEEHMEGLDPMVRARATDVDILRSQNAMQEQALAQERRGGGGREGRSAASGAESGLGSADVPTQTVKVLARVRTLPSGVVLSGGGHHQGTRGRVGTGGTGGGIGEQQATLTGEGDSKGMTDLMMQTGRGRKVGAGDRSLPSGGTAISTNTGHGLSTSPPDSDVEGGALATHAGQGEYEDEDEDEEQDLHVKSAEKMGSTVPRLQLHTPPTSGQQ